MKTTPTKTTAQRTKARPRVHRSMRGALLGVVVMASVLAIASPAQAHNYLISSTPSAGQTLTTLPAKFIITTNQNLLDLTGTGAGFAFEIRDSKGLYYGDGCLKVINAYMTTAATLGQPGSYTILWQIISADGHTVSDEIPFTWAPTGSYTVTKGTKTPGDCHGTQPKSTGASGAVDSNSLRNSDANLSDVVWIGGTLVTLALAVFATLFVLLRPRKSAN